jgi:hypothetical protein
MFLKPFIPIAFLAAAMLAPSVSMLARQTTDWSGTWISPIAFRGRARR